MRLQPGHNMRMARFGDRHILGRRRSVPFAHPWSVYNVAYVDNLPRPTVGAAPGVGFERPPEGPVGTGDKKELWTLQILPGFVNGVDPLAFGIAAEGTANGGRNYTLRGKGSELNSIGGASSEYNTGGDVGSQLEDSDDEEGWYPLLQGPYIPVNAYTSGRRVPPFFRDLGATPARAGLDLVINADLGVVQMNLTEQALQAALNEEPPPPRRLLGQDFWLQVERPAFRPIVTIEGNLVTGNLVSYDIGYDTSGVSRVGDRPRIYQGNFSEIESARLARTDLRTRLAQGGPGDDGRDYALLFTFWLLEPERPDAPPRASATLEGRGAAKDDLSGWEPYVEYADAGWWNLSHRQNNAPPFQFGQLQFDPSLAAFVGRYTIVPQATFGALEAEQNRILNAIANERQNEGRFWT